jgi:WS/DGAT/MGAT family acyltransferase
MTQQLSAQDAQFLYVQSARTLTHVMGMNLYDPSTARGGKVRFRDIVEHVRSRLDSSPVYRRKLHRVPFDIDFPYWVEDPDFELEAHITHARLPEPGDWRQLCIQAARHFSRPMDMTRPLWDLYIVEGLDRIPGVAPGSFASLLRVHHAAIDGASGAHMMASLSDSDAAGTPAVPIRPTSFVLGEAPTTAEVLRRAVSANLSSPLRFVDTLLKFSPALIKAAQKPRAERGTGIPATRFNAPVSAHKVFDATSFAIAELATLRALVPGATINDVVLAICSGALRQYLRHHGELPGESLVAIAPINRRGSSREAEVPGNNISAMSVELATQQADPVARLRAIHAYTSQAKEAKAGLSARVMTDLSKHIPGATLAGVARLMTSERFAPRAANLFISNVPGPQRPLYMAGALQTHQFAMAPLTHNMGLFIATPSYNGRISFNITSDRKLMPDVAFFRECVESAYQELAAAAARSAPKPASKRATARASVRGGRARAAMGGRA